LEFFYWFLRGANAMALPVTFDFCGGALVGVGRFGWWRGGGGRARARIAARPSAVAAGGL